MSIIQSYEGRSALSAPASAGFLQRSASAFAAFALRLGSAWRERSNLLLIESLPDDLRKDIGWPDGGRSR